jgi:hypothetical protein
LLLVNNGGGGLLLPLLFPLLPFHRVGRFVRKQSKSKDDRSIDWPAAATTDGTDIFLLFG